MKPWDCPLFQSSCENCGRLGWFWPGTSFGIHVCKGGCDPNEVTAFQEGVLREKERREVNKRALVSDGLGI